MNVLCHVVFRHGNARTRTIIIDETGNTDRVAEFRFERREIDCDGLKVTQGTQAGQGASGLGRADGGTMTML